MGERATTASGECVELLAQLIRNACVNDGTVTSGHEHRSTAVLAGVLEGTGADLQLFEPVPGRSSLVARVPGRDRGAPSLALVGHTDVVPVSAASWREDPFGGAVIDGEVWGRGAVDMLNQTTTMTVAVRRLLASGWRPRGDLVLALVADEEAGSVHGVEWLLEHEREHLWADHVLTEVGGPVRRHADAVHVDAHVGEKGGAGFAVHVHGTPGHGSMPFGADNALVRAAAVVQHLAAMPPYRDLGGLWPAWVAAQGFDGDVAAGLLDPDRVDAALASLPADTARRAHACCHATVSPNVIQGGTKRNVVPDRVTIDVDMRILPGDSPGAALARVQDWLAPFGDTVSVEQLRTGEGTVSPTDTELWKVLGAAAAAVHPGATLLPALFVAATDARFYRRQGAVAYGFNVLSDAITPERYWSMFHGNDERIDVESLRLSVQAWELVLRGFLT
jgi:acetylornithine deacetylase/succinyl-diaminopimelate desuccinylase-like protein